MRSIFTVIRLSASTDLHSWTAYRVPAQGLVSAHNLRSKARARVARQLLDSSGMSYQAFIERVRARVGEGGPDIATRATREVGLHLRALVDRDTVDSTWRLLGAPVPEGEEQAALEVESFYSHLAERLGAPLGCVKEHVDVICGELAAEVGHELRTRLQRQLPEDWARLFQVVPRAHAARASHHGRTLASGRPGSKHPVSASSADRAHHHSVARTPAPHGDTKLSTGATHADTLAEADAEDFADTIAEAEPKP
jgi:hypothetical protein